MTTIGNRLPGSTWLPAGVIACGLALLIGASVGVHQIAGAAMTFALAALFLARRVRRSFVWSLAVLLAAYALFGRGFAHLGIAPIYPGEIVLALGVMTVLTGSISVSFSRVTLPLLAFMAWGVITTLPFLSRDGVDALRDAVLWGYAVFAFLVLWSLDRSLARNAIAAYRHLMTPLLLWLPVGIVLARIVETPLLPGETVAILDLKVSDVGVHLGGMGAFVLLGLNGKSTSATTALRTVGSLACLALVGIINRGGLLAAAMAAPALTVARPTKQWLIGGTVASVLMSFILIFDPVAQVSLVEGRYLSVEQIGRNLTSIVTEEGGTYLEQTRDFRLGWWTTIVDYTVFGPYFWTGKGFGVNLGVDDGFLTSVDDPARDPHNTHIAVLARMGVPGLILWAIVLGTFAVVLLRALLRARATGASLRARVLGWVFLYWLAMLVNTTFDPYLSGPMGGIWFWSLFGYGLAVARADDWFRPHTGEAT
jgi:hypothetical protein